MTKYKGFNRRNVCSLKGVNMSWEETYMYLVLIINYPTILQQKSYWGYWIEHPLPQAKGILEHLGTMMIVALKGFLCFFLFTTASCGKLETCKHCAIDTCMNFCALYRQQTYDTYVPILSIHVVSVYNMRVYAK